MSEQKEILATLMEEAFDIIASVVDSVPRQTQFASAQNIIKVAVGMRRSGKTYFLYQTINQLLQEGIDQEQILFINFEDDRLLPMTAKEMGKLIDAFYSLYPENHRRKCYIFLDEVQNVVDWHRVVRRLDDSKNVQLYLTGSSAKLLSKEIDTSLRGRSLSTEIWPYSFSEYLKAHHIKIPSKPFGKKSIDVMTAHLKNYFNTGGFPAIQNLSTSEWRDTLQGYVDTVILRDIVERHNVSNVALLKYLTKSLLTNAACPFSVNKFHNDIKSQGYKVGKDTLYNYMDYLEDAYLTFSVPLYSESARERQTIPKKIYAIDNGLINASALVIKDIYNKFLENQIYLDLRRKGNDVYFYNTKSGYEVDFVSISKDGKSEIIQVTWDMSDPETKKREMRALKQAQEELEMPGKIITLKDYLNDFVSHKSSAEP